MLRSYLNGRTSGFVFQSRKGTPLRHPLIINRVLHPLLERLGIPKCGMHAFRHGRVSYLVENNTPVETIRAWIGHGSDQMVRLYTHLRPEGVLSRVVWQSNKRDCPFAPHQTLETMESR